MFLGLCRWSSLLCETTSSTGTTLWARMSPSYWRSDRRCRMPWSSFPQGTKQTRKQPISLPDIWGFRTNNVCFYIHSSCQLMVCVCVLRSKEVDWQPYFTTRLVDDFATHLRVFRKAQDRLVDREDKQSMRVYIIICVACPLNGFWLILVL